MRGFGGLGDVQGGGGGAVDADVDAAGEPGGPEEAAPGGGGAEGGDGVVPELGVGAEVREGRRVLSAECRVPSWGTECEAGERVIGVGEFGFEPGVGEGGVVGVEGDEAVDGEGVEELVEGLGVGVFVG